MLSSAEASFVSRIPAQAKKKANNTPYNPIPFLSRFIDLSPIALNPSARTAGHQKLIQNGPIGMVAQLNLFFLFSSIWTTLESWTVITTSPYFIF